jgi:CHAT domain-containing protein
MTLTKVEDEQAKSFVLSFYRRWLAAKERDASSALRATKQEWIAKNESVRRWAAFVLVEN